MLSYSATLTCDAPGCDRKFRRESIVGYGLSGAISDARALGWRNKRGLVDSWLCPEHAN